MMVYPDTYSYIGHRLDSAHVRRAWGAAQFPSRRKLHLPFRRALDFGFCALLLVITLLFVVYEGLFRTGEILRNTLSERHLPWKHVLDSAHDGSVRIMIGKTKTSRNLPVAVDLDPSNGSRPCAVLLLKRLKANQSACIPGGITGDSPVFPGMTAAKWRTIIKKCVIKLGLDPFHYSGHSLRAGAATDLFNMGVPYHSIQKRGRWKSDTFLVYFRDEKMVRRDARRAADRLAVRIRKRGGLVGKAPASPGSKEEGR